MLYSPKSYAVLLLILAAAMAALPTSGCGLNHCPRPRLSAKENPSLGWSLERTDWADGDVRKDFTQGSLHARFPMGLHWNLGGRLPLGYLREGAGGQWGWGNPLAYAEWVGRPAPAHAISLGLQAEIPFGDEESGIASGHAMLMPYASYAVRGPRLVMNASLGFAAQVAGGHSHGHEEGADMESHHHSLHADHAGSGDLAAIPADAVPVEDLPLPVNPHEPYELLYRLGIGLPLPGLRLEPEVSVSGTRVLLPETGDPADFLSLRGAVGVRIASNILLKPHLERQLTSPERFAWKTGLDVKFDVPGMGRKGE